MRFAMDSVVVALLNTTIEQPDPLADPLGTARWWASVLPTLSTAVPGIQVKPRFTMETSADLRRLREAVARLAAGEKVTYAGGSPGSEAIRFPILSEAAALYREGRLSRVRRCAFEGCSAYFLDRTKNGSKRWCGLRCMERARAPRRRTIAT
jgi:predicted RNA-binding Zn ribbon-like protein